MASKRKSEDTKDPVETKKQKIIPMTPTPVIKNFQLGNKSIIVKAYVDEILSTETFVNKETQKPFTVWKFLINNNDGLKIQCTVYNDLIEKFKNKIEINKIYLFQNIQVMGRKNYTVGNSPFEFLIKYNTTLEYLGDFNKKIIKPKKITFRDLPTKFTMISIQGYLRSTFAQHSQSKENEYISSITDGTYKLDVLLKLTNNNLPAYDRGSHLELTGELEKKDTSYILIITNEDNISLASAETMDLDSIIEGNLDIFSD